jgi:Bacterial transglutaminase-like cysteine proteinase BTLCP
VIAEIIPEEYDAIGRKTTSPGRRRGLRPTLPMGRYVSQPLAVECKSIEDVRKFLASCRVVSDEELFGKMEYWQPPEDFEKLKKGDCEDFALWTWRQLLAIGYSARVMFGHHGRYGIRHAWVTFEQDGRAFLVEPQYRCVGSSFPRLSTLSYHPMFSVAWDGNKLTFYSHDQNRRPQPAISAIWKLLPLIPEWIFIWGRYILWILFSVLWVLTVRSLKAILPTD